MREGLETPPRYKMAALSIFSLNLQDHVKDIEKCALLMQNQNVQIMLEECSGLKMSFCNVVCCSVILVSLMYYYSFC